MIKSLANKLRNFLRFVPRMGPVIDYQYNDPSTPTLLNKVNVPDLPVPCPHFSVQGWNGMGAPQGSPQQQAAEVYLTIVWSMRFIQSKLETPITNWSATQDLIALPRAGRDFNAYYDRSSLRFFYNLDPKNNKVIYTCESADVVSHELGHALLDSMRPDLWNSQSLEIFAFHESFGDMNAILTALSHEEVIEYVIRETGGDLKHSNVVSRLAEEMGAAIYDLTNGMGGRTADALRNAVNSFVYAEPETLSTNGPDNVITGEPHSFSRVFTGAFYDMICYLYHQQVATNVTPAVALATSRDIAARVLYNAVREAHNTTKFFDSVARAMLAVDQNHGGTCKDAILSSFTGRKILREIPMTAKPSGIKMDYSRNCKIYLFNDGSTVRVGGNKTLKLSEVMSTQTSNPLYNVEIEVPNDHYLEYDGKGRLKLELPVEKETTLRAARKCLDYLVEAKKVSFDEHDEREFKVVNNKLIRNHISCCCHHCKKT